MKLCFRCKTEKPLSAFNRNNQRKDGLSSYCRQCSSEYNEERYKKVYIPRPRQPSPPKTEAEIRAKKEREREWYRKRYQRQRDKRLKAAKEHYKKNRKAKKIYNHEYRQREEVKISEKMRNHIRYNAPENKQRNKARQAVNNAVKAGRLPHISALICLYEGCRKQADEYHHHKGYEDKHIFDVIPLCYDHHRLIENYQPNLETD